MSSDSSEPTPKPQYLPVVETIPQVRFSDTDMMGHISSMSYAAWAEVGRAEYFEAMHGEKPWFVLVHLALDFHSEGRFGESFRLESRCTKLGKKSMTLLQRITVDERPVCTIEVVMAAFDPETRKAIAIPTHWRPSPES